MALIVIGGAGAFFLFQQTPTGPGQTDTTTTQTTTTDTTTQTTTTETTTTQEPLNTVEISDPVELILTFSSAKITFTSSDPDTCPESEPPCTISTSYSVEGEEEIQATTTLRVVLSIEMPGDSFNGTVWIGREDGQVYRVMFDGQTYEGSQAQAIGQGFISIMTPFLGYSDTAANVGLSVTPGGDVAAIEQNWAVVEHSETNFEVGGNSYPALSATVTASAPAEVGFQSFQMVWAELQTDRWYVVQLTGTFEDGETFEMRLEELVLA